MEQYHEFKSTILRRRVGAAAKYVVSPRPQSRGVYPVAAWSRGVNIVNQPFFLARSDYAGSGGDLYRSYTYCNDGPRSLAQADAMNANDWANIRGAYNTGIFHHRSWVSMADVTDGISNTYLAGEKYIDPDHYLDGLSISDNWCWDTGWVMDVGRWSGGTDSRSRHDKGRPDSQTFPRQDTPGLDMWVNFGSAHPGGFNMVFCDGSVHSINYSIDGETHHRLGNIADGMPIDGKAY